VVRVGLLSQQQVIDVLNERFISVEVDLTKGVPKGVPALDILQRGWDTSPWSRVSFGSEWVMDPSGEFMLTAAPHKHGTTEIGDIAKLFEQRLEDGMERFERIRRHPAGSAEREAEEARVRAELDAFLEDQCWLDADDHTSCTLKVFLKGDVHAGNFEKKLSGMFVYPDPEIRRKVSWVLGRYAEREGDGEFQSSGKADLVGDKVAGLLEDERAEVRQAAAVALYQFDLKAVPELEGDELVASARRLWEERTARR
jgi:hypothetical protein